MTLVAVSDWIRGELAQSYLKEAPCYVIHNGIDLETFRTRTEEGIRPRYGIVQPVFYLAVASIWLAEKGLADLVCLASQLQPDEQLVLVGRMTTQQKAALPHNIVTIERTTDALALASLYAEATAFVNPTWQDNYPTVNLEAIACGTPVVTYRTGGSIESITPQTGFIVKQGDVVAMASCLHKIREKGKAFWQENCRNYALKHFDKKARFYEYIRLYEDLAAR